MSLRRDGLTIRMEDAAKGLQAKLSLKPEVRRASMLYAALHTAVLSTPERMGSLTAGCSVALRPRHLTPVCFTADRAHLGTRRRTEPSLGSALLSLSL